MYATIGKVVYFLFLVLFTGTCLLGYLMSNYSASYGPVQPPKARLHTFAFSYMDQITWAARRLKSLQCWSTQWKTDYSVYVVEPFVVGGSHLGVPNDLNQNQSRYLAFGNVFDMNIWNWGLSNTFSKTISWDMFLRYAPRNIIAVLIVYRSDYHCTENVFSEDYCDFTRFNESIAGVLEPHNFTLFRKVCINFRIFGSLTEDEFNTLIFRNIPLGLGVTVVFDEWRGIPNHLGAIDCWIQINSGKCSQDAGDVPELTSRLLVASSKIKKAANRYTSRFLNGKRGYVAVMIRWEKILLYDFYISENRRHYTGENCSLLIHNFINNVYKKWGLNTTFLSTDIGKYGSATFNLYNSTRDSLANVTRYTEDLMRTLHRNSSMSLAEYEHRFEEISGNNNPAFISQLQKTIAVRARCLLLVGGGTFHHNTMKLFKRSHGREKHKCYATIETC